MPTQVRYTDAEVEQLKTLFPDVDSLKLYRKYLLDLPLSHDEIDRIQATWAPAAVRPLIIKATLPVIDGNDPIGIGYDLLNNISLSETDFEYQRRRAILFVSAINYLNSRIGGLDTLPESVGAKGSWLTASILDGTYKTAGTGDDGVMGILFQLCIKQNVEGILLGLQGIINTITETPEQKAARETADSSL